MTLKFSNLTKKFDNHTVLDGLSMEFSDVKTFVFIGPSGGGKTTLLRMIAGLENPTSGDIEVNGKRIPYEADDPPQHSKKLRDYRKHIGVVFQNYNLFPHLTALKNITLPLEKVHGFTPADAAARAEELLTRFKLIDHAHKKPHALSGGQKQRIAISRALAPQPEYLLLDEPTSALDPEFTSEVLDMVRELRTEGIVDVIIVTHHMGFARSVSDYVLFVGSGGVLAHGAPNDLFTQSGAPPLVQNFFDKVLRY